jgi:hypothetical protein
MSIRSNHTWMIAGIILLVALFFLLRGSYFVGSGNTWPMARQSGSSLNGYWYYSKYGGCFKNKEMVLINEDRIYVTLENKIGMLPMKISKTTSGFIIDIVKMPNITIRHYITDANSELLLNKTQVTDSTRPGYIGEKIANRSYLRTCDNPTSKGYMKSLFLSIFSAPASLPELPQNPMEAQ